MNHQSGFLEFPPSAFVLVPFIGALANEFSLGNYTFGCQNDHIVSYKQPAKDTKSYVYGWEVGVIQSHWTYQEWMGYFQQC